MLRSPFQKPQGVRYPKMGLFDDILKGLPENAVLRAKVSEAKEENASLKQENAFLKDDLRKAKAEIVKLKEEISRLTHTETLEENEVKILVWLADPNRHHIAEAMAPGLQIHPTRLAYYLEALENKGYLYESKVYIGGSPTLYYIDQKGREFLIKNNLI
jgi:regulator of replication initiation timing